MHTMTLIGVPAACALSSWATTAFVVPRLPEPADDGATPGWRKPPYRSLATPGVQVGALTLGLGAGVVAATLPAAMLPVAIVLGGPVAALCLVDALTTFLPLTLTRTCQVLGLAGALTVATLSPDGRGTAFRLLCAAAVSFALFWGIWRSTRSLGYGDVRLAPLLALGPAALDWGHWERFLLLGPLAGALWGLCVALLRRWRPSDLGSVFPYGPGLWLGCWFALAS